jgi:hypothetical protein
MRETSPMLRMFLWILSSQMIDMDISSFTSIIFLVLLVKPCATRCSPPDCHVGCRSRPQIYTFSLFLLLSTFLIGAGVCTEAKTKWLMYAAVEKSRVAWGLKTLHGCKEQITPINWGEETIRPRASSPSAPLRALRVGKFPIPLIITLLRLFETVIER